jgi:hypothetical protein
MPKPDEKLSDPVTVRFQPYGLLASRCFRESGGLSCLTCHDPHTDAVRGDSSFYVARCLSCHAASAPPAVACRRRERFNCLPCHMRKAAAMAHLTFTDHRIRVY